VARPSGSAQVVEVEQADLGVLPALNPEVGDLAAGQDGQDRGGRAAEVGVGVLELLELGRGVAVDRLAEAVSRPVGVQGEDAVPPVEMPGDAAVEVAVPGRHEDPVVVGVVDDSGPRPDRALDVGAVRRAAFDEVDRLVAAVGVEDPLRAGGEVDRGDVALVVAGVPRVAPVRHVEVALAAHRRHDGESGRALLDVGLERGELGPAARRDLRAVAHEVLVDLALERVGVDVEAARIEGRRGGGVVRSGGRALRPHDPAVRRVDGEDAPVLRAEEEQVLPPERRRNSRQERRSPVGDGGQGDVPEDVERRDVAAVDDRLLQARAAVPGVEVELRPVRPACGSRGQPDHLHHENCSPAGAGRVDSHALLDPRAAVEGRASARRRPPRTAGVSGILTRKPRDGSRSARGPAGLRPSGFPARDACSRRSGPRTGGTSRRWPRRRA